MNWMPACAGMTAHKKNGSCGLSHEARINDALKQLGEEFRLGMVAAEEYRLRRRRILETWGERDVTTSPGSLSAAQLGPRPAAPPAEKARARSAVPLIVGAIVVLAVAAAAAYVLLEPQRSPGFTPAPVALPPPASPEVRAVARAADDFLARNAWDAEPIEAFLAHWRQLRPADRARARAEPAVRTLRGSLQRNIDAEAQLVTPESPPEARQRLDSLTAFAQELDG